MTVLAPAIAAVQEAVREGPRVLPHGGLTKPALSTPPDGTVPIDVSELTGILEYDPAELTFTALAGTPTAEVDAALAEHGQYLPFDPPLTAAGATLGGTVAAGASGPGAFRHGGVRDFLIGVQIVDGTGRLVRGGGKVVKNAAGFDLPKLMVGSLGRLGVMVELSFKVFPRPEATTTLVAELGSTAAAVEAMVRLGRGPVALDALDLEPPGRLLLRLGGPAETLAGRAQRLAGLVGGGPEFLDAAADAQLWTQAAELAWAPGDATLVRVGLTPGRLAGLEAALAPLGARSRYSLGGNVAWLAWPAAAELAALDALLTSHGLSGVVLRGTAPHPLLGRRTGGAFASRVRSALDPNTRFEEG